MNFRRNRCITCKLPPVILTASTMALANAVYANGEGTLQRDARCAWTQTDRVLDLTTLLSTPEELTASRKRFADVLAGIDSSSESEEEVFTSYATDKGPRV